MDLNTSVLLALITALGINQAVVRTPALEKRAYVFWSLQMVDLTLACLVLIFGLPGFGHSPAVGWVVGLLFVMHVAQNLKIRSDRQNYERREELDALKESERKRRRDRDYDAADQPDEI